MDIFDKGYIVYFTGVTQDTFDARIELEPFSQVFSEECDLEKVGMDDKFLYLHWGFGKTEIVPLRHLISLSVYKENK